ncbi:MAG: hypothetical protein WEC00_08940 [Dongiaceae bacterium]
MPVRVLRIGLFVMLGLSGLLLLDVVLLMIFFRSPPDDMPHSSGSNAVWAEQEWVGEIQDGATYDLFAATLERNAISDVFFHVGPLAADGTIDPALYGNAETLLAELGRRLPALRAQAWIGGRETRGGGSIDLADQTVRSRIAGTAATLLALGFDGIHYNIAPIESGNRRLLALLELTRPLVDAVDGTLSVAAEIIEPLPGTRRPIGRIFPDTVLWSSDYYAAIAERVDQVAVRMYDTGMPFSWAYGAIVGWLTPRVWHAMSEGQADLLIGVPTHRDEGGGFGADAETLESALTGIAYAIPRGGDAPSQLGLAIYAYGTTDDADWATWRRYWLGLSDPAE